jgi:hypothetical protein
MTTERSAVGAGALLLAWTSPVPGRADEYAEWLDSVHIPDVQAAVPAIRRSTRYRLAEPPESGEAPRFLVVHELGTDDVAAASAELNEALRAGRVPFSPDMDRTGRPTTVEWHVHESDITTEETR